VPIFDAASADAVYAALAADAVSDSGVETAAVGSGPAVLSNYLAVDLAGPRVLTSYKIFF
jgi:hypothetical protein